MKPFKAKFIKPLHPFFKLGDIVEVNKYTYNWTTHEVPYHFRRGYDIIERSATSYTLTNESISIDIDVIYNITGCLDVSKYLERVT